MKSYVLLSVCILFWGSNFVFGAILVKQFSPMLLSAIRLTFTSFFLIGYAWFSKNSVRLQRADWMLLIPLGFIGTLANQTAFFTGMKTVDGTTASLILSLAPITTAILASLFLREPLTKRVAAGAIIAVLGVYCVVGIGKPFQITAGMWLIFIAMLTFSVSIIMMRKLIERVDPISATMYSTVIGCGMQIIAASMVEQVSGIWRVPLWAWLLAIATALMMQGVCGLLWNRQIKEIGAAKAAIFLNLQPFVAMIVGFALLGTPVTWPQIGGSVLIIFGVMVATEMLPKRGTQFFARPSKRENVSS
ncbi:EamA family transporter [Paenibacillus cremeus]|uniref:EamA family transporter n=2 Tax=Paenibacillus cremeus TaxID=2163881 RepID=A0A559KG11_9BACL|nr:EamA family transporter [Paenibacillus cremeus]